MPSGYVQPPAVRFAHYVEPDTNGGCHLWWGYHDRKGYGFLAINWKNVAAHRFAYEQANGPIPEGMIVRHKCDTPACVNPAHLEVGTQAQNINDYWTRGRFDPRHTRTARGARQ